MLKSDLEGIERERAVEGWEREIQEWVYIYRKVPRAMFYFIYLFYNNNNKKYKVVGAYQRGPIR